jgi:predicted amidophosphoribosyltransferase
VKYFHFALDAWFFIVLLCLYPLRHVVGAIMRRSRRRRGLCPKCAYNLIGNNSGVCPECGRKIEERMAKIESNTRCYRTASKIMSAKRTRLG